MTMSEIIAPPSEQDVTRNSQVEGIFDNWNLKWRLEPAFAISEIVTLEEQQVRNMPAQSHYVDEYFQQHTNGAKFPPIVLRSGNRALVDGNTRLAMWKRAKLTTVPAYLVDLSSLDLALALSTCLNQIGGVRLTADESMTQAIRMLDEGLLDRQAIARIVGRSSTQVHRWAQEQEFRKRAEKNGLTGEAAKVAETQKRQLVRVVQAKPFSELVRVVASRRIPNGEVQKLVDEVLVAESEGAALELINAASMEFLPGGPDGRSGLANTKAKRMRMVLPQVLNLAPAQEFYDPDRAEDDYKMWREIAKAADTALAMYAQYGIQQKLGLAE
jgi:hypothetical protein